MAALRALNLAAVLSACLSGVALAAQPVCELAKQRGGLTSYAVEVSPNQNGDREIAADVDGDGSLDKITWFDPGSGSIIPADNSTLTATLSSTGRTFTVEEQRLQVVRYESDYFVVTRRVDSERGPWHSDVYSIGRTGIAKLCSLTGKGLGP